MKILFISNLFPDSTAPNRGSDNAVVLRYLSRSSEIRVLCPRPMLGAGLFHRRLASCPEDAAFQPIYRPVPYIPKLGSRFNHRLMASGIRNAALEIRKGFPFDVALASWIYPDACATAVLAREIGFPFVAIAQGSDVHQYLKIPARRHIILESMRASGGVITRSGDLARLLSEAGLPADKLRVVFNGIDFSLFHPADPCAARKELNLPENATVLLFVGNFLAIKNPLLLVQAHAELCRRLGAPPVYLVMVGSGPLQEQIRQAAATSGTSHLLILPGRKRPPEVARYMQAADLLCLSSHNEGLPNVVLEAFACGLRVVSTRVGGIHEVLTDDFLGGFVNKAKPDAMAATLLQTLSLPPRKEAIVTYASQFSWEKAALAYLDVLEKARG